MANMPEGSDHAEKKSKLAPRRIAGVGIATASIVAGIGLDIWLASRFLDPANRNERIADALGLFGGIAVAAVGVKLADLIDREPARRPSQESTTNTPSVEISPEGESLPEDTAPAPEDASMPMSEGTEQNGDNGNGGPQIPRQHPSQK